MKQLYHWRQSGSTWAAFQNAFEKADVNEAVQSQDTGPSVDDMLQKNSNKIPRLDVKNYSGTRVDYTDAGNGVLVGDTTKREIEKAESAATQIEQNQAEKNARVSAAQVRIDAALNTEKTAYDADMDQFDTYEEELNASTQAAIAAEVNN